MLLIKCLFINHILSMICIKIVYGLLGKGLQWERRFKLQWIFLWIRSLGNILEISQYLTIFLHSFKILHHVKNLEFSHHSLLKLESFFLKPNNLPNCWKLYYNSFLIIFISFAVKKAAQVCIFFCLFIFIMTFEKNTMA